MKEAMWVHADTHTHTNARATHTDTHKEGPARVLKESSILDSLSLPAVVACLQSLA